MELKYSDVSDMPGTVQTTRNRKADLEKKKRRRKVERKNKLSLDFSELSGLKNTSKDYRYG